MTEKTIPIKGEAYTFKVALVDQANPKLFKSAPTLAAGDVKVDTDGAGMANIASLPSASGKIVTVSLSSGEMNGDSISVLFSDAAGDEWCDYFIELRPSEITLGDIPTAAEFATAVAGAGSTAKTYTVDDGTNPLAGVHVWVTTDMAGSNLVASGYTDDSGEVVFWLDSGTTYYLWRQKKGYRFTNPDTEVA